MPIRCCVNETEQEAIVLNAAWAMIDDMVNWAMFVKFDEPLRNVLFETSQHARLFNILLGDFLSPLHAFKGKPVPFALPAAPSDARLSDLTFLFYLRRVCEAPRLGSDCGALADTIERFSVWLEAEFVAEGVNLADIDVVADVRIQRGRYLKICGDIAKHNMTRLESNVSHIRRALAENGHTISEQDGYLAIAGFYEWFHENIFLAHASVIADFLHSIRIGIHTYLRAEFARAYRRTDVPFEGFYQFDVPAAITEPVARAMYWDAMNRMRAGLYMRPFAISETLKTLY